jgi:metallophosphoesterase (TIGR00282 family)
MPRLLFIGDVVAEPGRRALEAVLPRLRERYEPEFIVVNGENVAGGMGITPTTADQIFAAGADAITLGNHTYRHREIFSYLDENRRIVRPANFHRGNPGRGSCVVEHEPSGLRLGVINLSGSIMLDPAETAFDAVDRELAAVGRECDLVMVDHHAEMTSEKVAMGWYLDGKVTLVAGTHTHVPTADARVLPGGTAYITDVGMTGSRAGVIGVVKETIITRMRTGMPARFDSATGDEWLMGVMVEADRDGRATAITQVIEALAAD